MGNTWDKEMCAVKKGYWRKARTADADRRQKLHYVIHAFLAFLVVFPLIATGA